MTDSDRARLVGTNHVAFEVGDIDEALSFYESVFAFELRGRGDTKAFLDMGDQFLALSETDAGYHDEGRHVGIVVDDPSLVKDRLDDLGIERLDTGGLDFRDPWGNRLQIVAYEEIQFTKADHVLGGMGLSDLEKSEDAIEELSEKGMAPGE
jgi:catechol 2,3-dioxygenase-like lactoylglutathione lyase family enzyme